ncbi:DsrE family protein [Rhodanobacter hydrolyticus]|uniref:DsrE family protein n=2 Tax=Rhodanobacteraceae TaxID=1775411 RepID=A0ABW8J1R8_9GAMM|nr:DsrE family protein [Rhodanobacter sp. 7MK24]
MNKLLALSMAMGVAAQGGVTHAADATEFWSNPTISPYGKIHWLPDSAYRPQPDQTYSIVFALSVGAESPSQVNASLDRVARSINLYTQSGVPLNHLKFVAVAYGPATPLVLDDAHYKAAYGVPNPNLPLIRKLRDAGVDVAVCGQAVAEHKYQYDWVDKSVTISLSALTTISTLEHQGYSLVQL